MNHLVRTSGVLAGCAAFLAASSTGARAQSTTQLVSVSSSGVQGNADCYGAAMSSDARYVAFGSMATNLVPGDSNGQGDVFVRDRSTGTTTRVSVSSSGVQGDWHVLYPSISGDGRFVAFDSGSSLLVPTDTNNNMDVFLHDLQTGQTSLVSLNSAGIQSDSGSHSCVVSFDGRYVAFVSYGTNLVANDNNGTYDVFRRDRQTGQTVLMSKSSSGVQANWDSGNPSISYDGRYVCFVSGAFNLVPNDTNGWADVFVHDTLTGQTVRANVSSTGGQSVSPGIHGGLISGDGRWVAFSSFASDYVSGDNNGTSDVFVHDLLTGQTSLVSVGSSGAQGNGNSAVPAISADGRYVAFTSTSTDLVTQPPVSGPNVYVRDRLAGTTTVVSVNSNGFASNFGGLFLSISDDGRSVAFASSAPYLVPEDLNDHEDVFVHHDIGPVQPVFCLGDGTGTACPCGNASPPGSSEGCMSSVGTGGRLLGTGTPSVGSDNMTLLGSQMPNSFALYFQGTTKLVSGAGFVFGDGLRCAGGTIIRLGAKLNVGGTSQFPAVGDLPLSVRGACSAGDFRTYQVWYRNVAPFCTPSTFNLTNGVEIMWAP